MDCQLSLNEVLQSAALISGMIAGICHAFAKGNSAKAEKLKQLESIANVINDTAENAVLFSDRISAKNNDTSNTGRYMTAFNAFKENLPPQIKVKDEQIKTAIEAAVEFKKRTLK